MSLSAAAALTRTRNHIVTRQTPQGMCLNFVWRMFGSVNSTGYAAGSLTTALNAWNHSRERYTDRNIPIGAPVYFGSSPTRTDKNKHAGDVMVHVGNGVLGGTDVSGANTGYITIDARARQIQRPYLGWCADFGGHPIDFGVDIIPAGNGSVIIKESTLNSSDLDVLIDRMFNKTFVTSNNVTMNFGQAIAEIQVNARSLSDAMFRGGDSMADGKRSVSVTLADLRKLTEAIDKTVNMNVIRDPQAVALPPAKDRKIPLKTDLIEGITILRQLAPLLPALEEAFGEKKEDEPQEG